MSFTTRTRLAVAAIVVAGGTVLGTGVASAADCTDPYVCPSSVVQNEDTGSDEAPEVLSNTASNSPQAAEVQSSLAFTGSDAAGMALLGGTALAAGTAILVARRRSAEA